jgi:hypothetical protein
MYDPAEPAGFHANESRHPTAKADKITPGISLLLHLFVDGERLIIHSALAV